MNQAGNNAHDKANHRIKDHRDHDEVPCDLKHMHQRLTLQGSTYKSSDVSAASEYSPPVQLVSVMHLYVAQ